MVAPQNWNSFPFSLTGISPLAATACLTLLFASFSVVESRSSAMAAPPTASPDRELPTLTRLRNESRALLRKEALLEKGPAKDAAATALCDLYVILRLDSRYSGSDMLQGDATRIRRRLITISKKKEQQLKRNGIARPANLTSSVNSTIAAAILHHQNKAAKGEAAADHGDAGTGSSNPSNSDQQNSTPSNHGQNRSSAPNVPSGQAGPGIPDTGWELVELIQRVISPDFWESRGGPGSIRYFAMRRVLVIRATTDIHEQIRDLLMALR